jgi:CheY-like chemotaxis protein
LGLGLAIVRQVVELHGGTVKVESPGEGQGARFIVKLPLLVANQQRQDADRETSSLLTHSLPLAGLSSLVVDDETDSRDLVAFVLEQAGAVVTSASSADEALTILSQAPPDVFLSDIGMPVMDGYAFMRQVRSLPDSPGKTVPAIALTAYAGELNQQQAIAAGFQLHISKPVEPKELVNAIANLSTYN